MKKKGATHIEIILSFILFASAVGFALYFLNPVDHTRLVDSSLGYASREILDNTSISVDSLSVLIKNTPPERILSSAQGNIIAVNISGIPLSKNVRVEELDGTVLPSERSGEIVYIKNSAGWPAKEFVYIRFSEDFDSAVSVSPHPFDNSTFYEISSSENINAISEKKMLYLNTTYFENYQDLKEKRFNLPNRVNFGFSLKFDDNKNIIAEKNIPNGLEVFSDNKRTDVLRKNGALDFGDFNIKIW
ncbi:MAG: hypothetical protein Q7S74_02260 [Nanoarchaeota archaeon]|nr:hypothetical protein [Nanoarchaeota archaeon]